MTETKKQCKERTNNSRGVGQEWAAPMDRDACLRDDMFALAALVLGPEAAAIFANSKHAHVRLVYKRKQLAMFVIPIYILRLITPYQEVIVNDDNQRMSVAGCTAAVHSSPLAAASVTAPTLGQQRTPPQSPAALAPSLAHLASEPALFAGSQA